MTNDGIEEETYSVIFASLKHPVRRRILRMLTEKPLAFSEILETLKIDSGHLSYHLENLGDLVTHLEEGKYSLSSIGIAAVKLMGGVEEGPKANHTRTKPQRTALKAFSIVLALSLIITGFYLAAVMASTSSNSIISSATLNQDNQVPANFSIAAAGTFAFNVTLVNWVASLPVGSTYGGLYLAPTGPYQWSFFIPTTRPATESLWVDLRLNFTSIMPSLLAGTPVELPNDLTLKVLMPDGSVATTSVHQAYGPVEGSVDPWTWGGIGHYVSPEIQLNGKGTYRFSLTNNGSSDWTGTLMPYVYWQQTETQNEAGTPYIYYGLTLASLGVAYVVFAVIDFVVERKPKTIIDSQRLTE